MRGLLVLDHFLSLLGGGGPGRHLQFAEHMHLAARVLVVPENLVDFRAENECSGPQDWPSRPSPGRRRPPGCDLISL